MSTIKFSAESEIDQSERLNQVLVDASKEMTARVKQQLQEEQKAMSEFLIKYGDYYAKRAAIVEKYERDVAKSKTVGEREKLKKELDNELDKIDKLAVGSITLMGKVLAGASQRSVEELRSILKDANALLKYAESPKDEEGNAEIGGKTVSRQDVLDLGVSENTLDNLQNSTEEVNKFRDSVAKLDGALVKSPFEKFTDEVKASIGKLSGGKKDIAGFFSGIGGAITTFAPALSQFGKDLGNLFGDDNFSKKAGEVVKGIEGIGGVASGVGQMMSGDIGGGIISVVSGISKVVDAFEGLFGADYSHYNKAKAHYEALNKIWDDLIEKKKTYIKESYGSDAVKAGKDAEELVRKQIESNQKLGKMRLASGASAGSRSIGRRIREDMSDTGWKQAREALGDDVDSFNKGRMYGLFDLSGEQLEKLRSEAPVFWAQLNGDVRKYLENIIAGSEELEKIQGIVQEQLIGVSFDDFKKSFVETLLDMDSSAADFADNFERYLMRALLNLMIEKGGFKDNLEGIYTDYVKYAGDEEGLTQNEANELQERYQKETTNAIQMRDDLFNTFGLGGGSGGSSSASSGGFATMSQDSGDELNGRFAALQLAGEEIRGQALLQSETLSRMLVHLANIDQLMGPGQNDENELLHYAVLSYLELQGIGENTRHLKTMAADLGEIKQHTARL